MSDAQDPVHLPPQNTRVLFRAGTAALVLLSLFLLVETVVAISSLDNKNTSSPNTLVVSGKGQAAAIPDSATLSYTVAKTASTVSAAMDAATRVQKKALAAIEGEGVAAKDIRTTAYTIQPHRTYRPCPVGTSICPPAKITGYDVSQTVSVKIPDLAAVSGIIAQLGAVGVSNLSGPNFSVSNPTAVKDEARAKAIAQAKEKARALATQLGVRLGHLIHYTETTGPGPLPYALSAASRSAEAPSLPVGENEYTVTVSLTYAIQ